MSAGGGHELSAEIGAESPGIGHYGELIGPDGSATLCQWRGAIYMPEESDGRPGSRGHATSLLEDEPLEPPLDGSWRWRPVPVDRARQRSGLELPAPSEEMAADPWFVARRRSAVMRAVLPLVEEHDLALRPWPAYEGDGERFSTSLEREILAGASMAAALGRALFEDDDRWRGNAVVVSGWSKWARTLELRIEREREAVRGEVDAALAGEQLGLLA